MPSLGQIDLRHSAKLRLEPFYPPFNIQVFAVEMIYKPHFIVTDATLSSTYEMEIVFMNTISIS